MKLNDHFKKFIGKISLNPTREERIKNALSNWEDKFSNDEEIEDKYIDFFPQGSYSTNTTIKPKEKDEYDIDAVLLLEIDENEAPKDILYLIRDRIVKYKDFEDKAKVKDRCIRINYADDFHVDIVPALPHNEIIKIPTKKDQKWTETNPAGFAEWCNDIDKNTDGHFSKVVKIFKHWRDLKVGKNTAPKSILLTTLIGHSMEKKPSIAESLVETLGNIVAYLEDLSDNDVIFVENPSLFQENIARDWDHEKANRFLRKIEALYSDAEEALHEKDKESSIEKWKNIFGEIYFPSDLGEGKNMADKVRNGEMKVNSTGQLNTQSGTKVKDHRFYGDKK